MYNEEQKVLWLRRNGSKNLLEGRCLQVSKLPRFLFSCKNEHCGVLRSYGEIWGLLVNLSPSMYKDEQKVVCLRRNGFKNFKSRSVIWKLNPKSTTLIPFLPWNCKCGVIEMQKGDMKRKGYTCVDHLMMFRSTDIQIGSCSKSLTTSPSHQKNGIKH